MKYYIYYSDDYDEMGGKGLEICDTPEQAETFILNRKKTRENGHYTVIKGEEMEIKIVEVATKIKIGT